MYTLGLPHWLSGKESACSTEDTGDAGSIPGSGRAPAEGTGNPLQDSCRENAMDRGAAVHRVATHRVYLHNDIIEKEASACVHSRLLLGIFLLKA